MKKVITGMDLGQEFLSALGLPKNTFWFKMTANVDDPILIECGFYPEIDSKELIEKFSKEE